MKNFLNPMLLADFYKLSHRLMYPEGTQSVYSTWTPRTSRIAEIDEVVVFGIRAFIQEYLIDYFNEQFFDVPKKDIVDEYKRIVSSTLGVQDPNTSHIEALHDLGYLPLTIEALPEGTKVPLRTPIMTIENTLPEFFWLTNYIETLASCSLWQASTSATIADKYRQILEEAAMKTVGNIDFVPFQGHDFSMRGMSSLSSAISSGMGHLLSFCGTDTIPAIQAAEHFYGADVTKELVGTSIPASEHSIECSYGDDMKYLETLITKIHPEGFVSIVSDGYDFWDVISRVIPELKDKIMARNGKVVIRPDSGDPVKIVCGEVFPEFKTLEEAKDRALDILEERASEDCEGSYNVGNAEYSLNVKIQDKYFKITCKFEYNRHDKTYYYVDERELKSIEEFIPTLEQKGAVEALWDIFGGTTTEKGYKLLDSHIGLIYGDAITINRAKEIISKLEQKGFASINVVFGIGSHTYQYNTRDTFGFALKSTHCVINGEEKMIFKDPKTDNGVKKSQKGRVEVCKTEDGKIVTLDSRSSMDLIPTDSIFELVFHDGVGDGMPDNFSTIRKRLRGEV